MMKQPDAKQAEMGQQQKAARNEQPFLIIAKDFVAPQVGLEPTTLRLTAECSAIELLRNTRPHIA